MQQFFKRFSHLLKQPAYRTKIAVFILLGLLFNLFALRVSGPNQSILLEFSVTFSAVALTQIIWDFLGGDPLSEQIDSFKKETFKKLDAVHPDFPLLEDMLHYSLGLARFWPDRRVFIDDPNGLREWKRIILSSKKIFMLGITLWNGWMQDSRFREGLVESIKRGSEVKILIYEPGTPIQKQRAIDEQDFENIMVSEIIRTLKALELMRANLSGDDKRRLQVKLTYEFHHAGQIICTDNEILVGLYLNGEDGFSSPTMAIGQSTSKLYSIYEHQAKILWERSKDSSNVNVSQIVISLSNN